MRQLLLICFLLLTPILLPHAAGQVVQLGPNDTIRLGAIVVDRDTLPYVFMDEFYVKATLPQRYVRRREEFNRLRYNIQRTYPYAVAAADILRDVDARTNGMEKRDRKAYLKIVEKEMNKRFKGELQNLSITQGQILVKLISRQTGRNCFSIIKEVKGGFNAFVWQGVAMLFSNNLKRDYDPEDRDRDIETIVRDLEAGNYYRYQAQTQGFHN